MSPQNNCPICHAPNAQVESDLYGSQLLSVSCPRCGNFEISGTLAATERHRDQRWLLSAAIRNRLEQGEHLMLTTSNVEEIFSMVHVPKSPSDSIDLLIRHIHQKTTQPGLWISFNSHNDFPLVYARNHAEFDYYIDLAKKLSFLEVNPQNGSLRLDLKGWERILELEKSNNKSSQAYVAMWFAPDMNLTYLEGIKPALEDRGYIPVRVDGIEHNEKIDDRIIAEIRRSGLMVADFTGHRNGVYFEAGFAMGLGISVIRTCRADHINNLHFDTRQYNHIVWDTPADLRTKLVNRIDATVPRTA